MNLVKKWWFRQVALAVVCAMFVVGSIPAKSMAYVVGADAVTAHEASRAADMDTLQRVLESKLVAEKLGSMGLTMDEIKPRIEKLTDEELHSFASQVDSVYPGGDGLGAVIALLIIVILVLVILKIADRKLIIR